jgi:hypothetical protein
MSMGTTGTNKECSETHGKDMKRNHPQDSGKTDFDYANCIEDKNSPLAVLCEQGSRKATIRFQ